MDKTLLSTMTAKIATLFIKELLDKKGEVNLFTRPRRFGKTLTLDMLRCFFEDGYPE